MVSIGSKHFSTTEYNTILPYLGSTGKSVRWWPNSVNSSKGSSASICCNYITVFRNVLVWQYYCHGGNLYFVIQFFMKMICNVLNTFVIQELCLICQIYVDTRGGNNIFSLTYFEKVNRISCDKKSWRFRCFGKKVFNTRVHRCQEFCVKTEFL